MAAVETLHSWETMPCTPDEGPARTAAIGLVTLSNDVVIEPELHSFLAGVEGAAVFASRIPLMLKLTPQGLRDMEAHIPRAVELIVPDDRLDVMAFGCTSGSMAIGPERVAAAVHRSRSGIPVTDPVSAALKGLKSLGARRIALLTPYPDAVNEVVAQYVGGQGFEIAERASFKQPNGRSTDMEGYLESESTSFHSSAREWSACRTQPKPPSA